MCQRLTLIILATWEAEVRRIPVPRQPRQKSLQDLHLNGKKLGIVVGW
jgi:hypothetical protein